MCNEKNLSFGNKKDVEEPYFKTEINLLESYTSYKDDYGILIYISLILIGLKMSKLSTYRNGITGLMITGWMIFFVAIIWIIYNISFKTSNEIIYKYGGSEMKVKYGILIIILSIILLSTCEIVLLQFMGIILILLGAYCIYEYIRNKNDGQEKDINSSGDLVISKYGLKIPRYGNIKWDEVRMIFEFMIDEELYVGIIVDNEKKYRLVDKTKHTYLMKKLKFLRVIYESEIYERIIPKNRIITLSISQLSNKFHKCIEIMEYHYKRG
ncbi:hypothetical protein [Oceanirhabdus sp. W0125-5]|uniref:hypothetical protein n=1 Tax=Oceanirhabdus sp. W0125-5 TaxID=2999116 RepID=UPI0022F2D618|nr:hypothetical protein [Oceanirhabdus sp. W0125-5]WBW99133.1 hypothetical protein OW730_10410 [Oceanirhabdus sp. W0125-5]